MNVFILYFFQFLSLLSNICFMFVLLLQANKNQKHVTDFLFQFCIVNAYRLICVINNSICTVCKGKTSKKWITLLETIKCNVLWKLNNDKWNFRADVDLINNCLNFSRDTHSLTYKMIVYFYIYFYFYFNKCIICIPSTYLKSYVSRYHEYYK